MEKLQRIENNVYRQIMGAPRYTQETALRGEIGASSMQARIMITRIIYYQYILKGKSNDLLKRIGEEMKAGGDKWVKETEEYMKQGGIDYERLRSAKKEQIKEDIQRWDTRKWQREMMEKSSLKIYREWRKEVGGQEEIYDNQASSVVFFKCRTNNLNLNYRKRFRGESTMCEMCGAENENLNHFLLWCTKYNEKRNKCWKLQRPYIEDEDQVIGELLFDNLCSEQSKEVIYNFWKKREEILREREVIV